MNIYKVTGLALSAAAVFLVFQNCSSQNWSQSLPEPGIAYKTNPQMAKIDTEVKMMIADKTCNLQTDCASIAYGTKPCGGPETYLIYSKPNLDSGLLQQMVAAFNQLMDEENRKFNLAGTCEVRLEPAVACIENQCQESPPEQL